MRRERCLQQNTGDKGVKQESDEDGEDAGTVNKLGVNSPVSQSIVRLAAHHLSGQ